MIFMRFVLVWFWAFLPVMGYSFDLSGKVLDAKNNRGIEFATLWVEGSAMGTITDENGHFTLSNVPEGDYVILIRCLGYTEKKEKIRLSKNTQVVYYLTETSLALEEVTVTAERKAHAAATTYTLNRTALDHLQSVSVADAFSLLPGEQTTKFKTLTSSEQVLTLRGESVEMGHPDFGTVVEMDGVRLSTNATTQSTGGTDLRNVGNHNVERIEVVTGVPSVEYGDLTNGVVRIITRKGKSPLLASVSVRPHTQSYSVSKGLDLGKKRGVVNLSYERVRSVSDIASPFTSYIRNAFGLKYSNALHFSSGRNLVMDVGVNGNIGGMNAESDPDAFRETYTKKRDNAVWSSVAFHYMVNSNWLSNLRWGATLAYSDKRVEMKSNKSASSAMPALHTTEEGYFVAAKYEEDPSASILLQPTGYWYVTSRNDNRPLNYAAYVKAKWTHKWGNITSNLLLGSDLKSEGNLGRGEYYTDRAVAPSWREYRFDRLPFLHNWASYLEEDLSWVFGDSRLNLKAGIRNDRTLIAGSEYGTVSSMSPRLSAHYAFGYDRTGFFRGATLRMGWGKAVKLPSFEILYPRETYEDRLAFAPGTMADGTTYYAYHTRPVSPLYNASLKWQYNVMREVGIDVRVKGVNLSLSFFYNSMRKPYAETRFYAPFTYKLTDQRALEGCAIPSANRVFQIDQTTGVVTVSDKTGVWPSQTLDYKEVNDFQSVSMSTNGSSSSRMGLEWVLDFDKIKAIQTSVRLDGKYYRYKGIDEVIEPSRVNLTSSDGQPYKYTVIMWGNRTFQRFQNPVAQYQSDFSYTHIPKLRMIFSLRLEGTFMNTRRI